MINEYLLQYKGKTLDEKILEDARKYLLEEKLKKHDYQVAETALVYVTDPKEKKKKEILGLGGSIPNDIINNNIGFWLAELIQPLTTGAKNTNDITLDDGTTPFITIYTNSTSPPYNNTSIAVGASIQVGAGTTTPQRSDFNIETKFANGGAEDNPAGTSLGIFNSGLGSVKYDSNILSSGSGTINESVSWFQWRIGGVARVFMIAHDAISPAVGFNPAQTITVEYTWTL